MAQTGSFGRRTRVSVVDDDEDTRKVLTDILQSGKGVAFAGAFSGGKEALTAMPHMRPDLALVDLRLPDMDGIECTKQLVRLMPDLQVIILSASRDPDSFNRSLESGAINYLLKPVDPDQLIATLRFASIRAGEEIMPRSSRCQRNPTVILNARERAVLSKLAEGLQYKEIPDVLGISYTALRKAQHRIFQKLHATNRSEAVHIWLQK